MRKSVVLPANPRTGPDLSSQQLDGPQAWLVAASAFVSLYTVFGVAYSFNGFFGPMAEEFGSERSATAVFFSFTTFLYFGLGVVTGGIADRRGPRPVMLFGAACMVIGLIATSRVTSIYLGYATYGFGVGIGVACGYVPMVAAVGGWFAKNRTTALGVAVAGIGVGTLVNAPLAEWLINRYGWRDAYVVLAIGAGVLMVIASLGANRPPTASAAETPLLRALIGKNSAFWLLYASMAVLAFPLFMPFVFLSDYLEAHGSTKSAGLLLGIVGLASVAGRLGLGAMAARTSAIRLYQLSVASLAVSFLIWIAADGRYWLLVAFAVAMGVSYGGFIALAPAVAAEAFGPVGLGGVLGALYTAAGVGGLVGPPTMGAIVDAWGYQTALSCAFVTGLVAAVILTPLAKPAPR